MYQPICLICGMPISADDPAELDTGFPLNPSRADYLRYRHASLDACRTALNRLPLDLCCYAAWRYGPDPLDQLDERDPCEG